MPIRDDWHREPIGNATGTSDYPNNSSLQQNIHTLIYYGPFEEAENISSEYIDYNHLVARYNSFYSSPEIRFRLRHESGLEIFYHKSGQTKYDFMIFGSDWILDGVVSFSSGYYPWLARPIWIKPAITQLHGIDTTCPICWDNVTIGVICPANNKHMVGCNVCSHKVDKCPFCRIHFT